MSEIEKEARRDHHDSAMNKSGIGQKRSAPEQVDYCLEKALRPCEPNHSINKEVNDVPIGNVLFPAPECQNNGPPNQSQPTANKSNNIIKSLNPETIPLITNIKIEEIDSDEDNLVCKAADATTQTSLNFIKAIIRAFIFERIKNLEHSLITDTKEGKDIFIKIKQVQKENKDLEILVLQLQEKIKIALGDRAQDRQRNIGQEISSSAKNASDNNSVDTLTKQSAVISPYNVTVPFADTTPSVNHPNLPETSKQQSVLQSSVSQPSALQPHALQPPTAVPRPPGPQQQFLQQNAQRASALSNQHQNFMRRTGPQVKYVPLRPPQSQPPLRPPHSQPSLRSPQSQPPLRSPQTQHPQGNRLPYSNLSQSQFQANFNGYTPQQYSVISNRPPTPNDRAICTGQTGFVTTPPRMSSILSQQRMPHYVSPRPSGPQQPHATETIRQTGNSNQTYHYIPRPTMSAERPHIPVQATHNQRPFLVQERRGPGHSNNIVTMGTVQGAERPQFPPPSYTATTMTHGSLPPLPAKLHVNINVTETGIVLSWDNDPAAQPSPTSAEYYHLFASQDSPSPPTSNLAWKKIGVVKALPLPMACTLTQFAPGNSYHFAIRAVDIHNREGPLSNPCTVTLS